MTDNLWRKERTRLYLLAYNELLYLLNKYPKSTPFKLKQTKDASTQTSPYLFNQHAHIANINKNSDISAVSTTFVMTSTSTISTKISPASTPSPTIIMSPSPDTKKKKDCDPFTKIAIQIIHTPPPKPIPFLQNNNNKSMKTVHASALKVSDSLLNSLILNNSHNDSENDSQSQSQNKNKTKTKKRSYQQLKGLNDLNHTFSQCNVHENNRPLKRRKISKKISPTEQKQERKNMLLQYYNMNKANKNNKPTSDFVQKKAVKPPLLRSKKNPHCFSVLSTNIGNNGNENVNNIKKQLTFEEDNYDSIESASPPFNKYKKQKKTVQKKKKTAQKKKKTAKLTIISRKTSVNTVETLHINPKQKQYKSPIEKQHKSPVKIIHKNKQKHRKRSCLSLQKTAESEAVIDDSNFFGLLPELDAQSTHNAKQMSDNEIIRFENNIANISRISPINNKNKNNKNDDEREWKLYNESIPECSNLNCDSERFVIRKQRHKYTPLWKASTMNLPENEKHFDIKKLSADNDTHPLEKYNEKYLDCNDMSPQTKLAQHRLLSGDRNVTHSQIVQKYQKNVTCFVGKNHNDICEENSGSKVSLFEDTDFSAEQTKINSLLDSNENNLDRNQNNNGKHKYSVFKYPQ